ncbi:MAG: exodeoxyribonuclease VII large subunit [Desulfohalobiaceae bacterium]
MPHIFSVHELTRAVKEVLEGEFPFVWVQGQVGGVSRPGSGHVYFSLKDEDALLNVVWFKSSQWQGRGTGPDGLDQGQHVVCAGRLAVYPPRGTYQLIAEYVQEQGLGRLFLEFEALKKRLSEEGLFAAALKRPLPRRPVRVGVVTAPGGAAVRDFLRLADSRGCGARIRIYPSLMQGEGAGDNVVLSLEQANLEAWAEVLVLIRGGGSLEDLWTFNTEEVARAVRASAIPVVSGIGHEVDTTITDLAADVRASTPSHVAQLLWPERVQLVQEVDELEGRLRTVFRAVLEKRGARLETMTRALRWFAPDRKLTRAGHHLEGVARRLCRGGLAVVSGREARLGAATSSLLRSSPETGQEWARRHLKSTVQRLHRATNAFAAHYGHCLDRAESSLMGLDPDLPLQRGYGLVRKSADNSLVRDPAQVAPGDLLDITVRAGSLTARVSGEGQARKGADRDGQTG